MSAPDAAPASTDPAAPAPKSKMVPIFLALNSLLLMGVVGVLLLRPAAQASGPASHGTEAPAEGKEHGEGDGKAPAAAGPTARLADFVIHLRNTDVDRYARFAFEVELGSEQDKVLLTSRTPKIRDAFIGYLSDRTLEELQGSQALIKAKAGLLEQLEATAPGIRVRGLYITDFVVQ